MKLTIVITVTAFLLGGCLESVEPELNNELVVIPAEVSIPPVVPPVVASMLVNTQNAAGDFQNYWDCAVIGDDAPFLVALAGNGEGNYQSSDGATVVSWSEQSNGTLSVELTQSGELIEWTNFDFVSLFEFTADRYQTGQLVESDRCVLTDVTDTLDTAVSEGYFVTADSISSPDSASYIWECIAGFEEFAFFFYADNTGVIGFSEISEDGEIVGRAEWLEFWSYSNDSLETYLLNDTDALTKLITLNSITVSDENNFTAAEVIIGSESFGGGSCLKEFIDS